MWFSLRSAPEEHHALMKRTEVRRWVLVQFEIRRRRWLISAQGSSLRELWDHHINDVLTLKGFANRRTLSGFACLEFITQGCRCAPIAGLKLANAFGVFKLASTRRCCGDRRYPTIVSSCCMIVGAESDCYLREDGGGFGLEIISFSRGFSPVLAVSSEMETVSTVL